MSTTRVTAALADFVTIAPGRQAASTDDRVAGESRALVAAAQAGDRLAFGRLVDLHQAAALRTAMAALGRREDAEDVVQDAFVLAWRCLPGFRGDAAFRTWLLAIVWRRALDRRKARDRWWRRNAPIAFDDFDVSRGATAATPEDDVINQERRRNVADAIRTLPPKLRDALLLAASGEHTYDEIARLQGIRPGTVKWRVFEARRIVRAQLELRGDA
jgi:RNA polymerase sigma-70 factor (ECF subfamily)